MHDRITRLLGRRSRRIFFLIAVAGVLPVVATGSASAQVNGGFENGSYSPSGLPTSWVNSAFNASAVFTWDNTQSHSGTKSVKIAASTPNDARWYQDVPVTPNTNYRIAGWIKTDSVSHTADFVDTGASLSIYGCHTDIGCFQYSAPGLFGTNDWTWKALDFNSGSNTHVVIAGRLGMYSGTVSGTAWFDDIVVVQRTTGCEAGAPDGFNCNDDVFCNGADTCQAGVCLHAGDPCTTGNSCSNTCDETSNNCYTPAGSACPADSNACTYEICDGFGNCTSQAGNAGTVCRTATGVCDVAETCNGTDDFCPADSFAPFNTPCASDGNVCTNDVCNGGGSCAHPGNSASCDDGNVCTVGDTCYAGSCYGGAAQLDCDDSDLCTTDTCQPGVGCVNSDVPIDSSSCLAAPKARIQISDPGDAEKRKLSWQWAAGAAFDQSLLGTPKQDTTYALCVYDSSGSIRSLAASVVAAPSPTSWFVLTPKGLRYEDAGGTSDGLTKAQIKTGEDGRTKIKWSAAGGNVPLPGPAGAAYLQSDPSVVVQLVTSDGVCWTSEFSAFLKNDASKYKAKMP